MGRLFQCEDVGQNGPGGKPKKAPSGNPGQFLHRKKTRGETALLRRQSLQDWQATLQKPPTTSVKANEVPMVINACQRPATKSQETIL